MNRQGLGALEMMKAMLARRSSPGPTDLRLNEGGACTTRALVRPEPLP